MRTIEYGTTTHVPAFLTKLWKLVTDSSCDELICWSLAGTSFIIYDEIRFSKELLPMYFKHNNMASFVRQLNMYGFRKLSCIDQGGMHCYKNEIEFYHQYFLKGQETLLELIKRKIPNSRSEEPKVRQEYIEELISNIKTLKGKQDSAEQGMRYLKRENKMLWRHVNMLTDRYTKQQSVLQQLLPFFVNMVRSSREMALKRKAPLMIDDGERENKIARMSPPYYVHHSDQDSNQGMPSSSNNVTNRGPVIHEVTEMENSKMFHGSILCSSNTSSAKECEAIVDSPLSCNVESSEQTIDSPFTEPATMETLNILNQNFESRSRSNSMSSCHSQLSISSSSMRLPSPSVMTSTATSSPSSSYPTISSSIPPTIIIDETTSDVPLISESLLNNFVPKMEETCSDSGVYSINSLLSHRVSHAINESTSSINQTTALLNEATPSMMAQRLSMLNSEVTPLINNSSSMTSNSSLPAINEVTSARSGNKFTPYVSAVKSMGQEMNWMMNQDIPAVAPLPPPSSAYGAEPNFENWLGQIFKSDNLTPGCSLPQGENVSYV